MSRKKIIIQSFLLAFMISFFTIFMLFPETKEIAYTNIGGGTINVSSTFLFKVIAILLGQTSALGSVFYVLAKKIFIK